MPWPSAVESAGEYGIWDQDGEKRPPNGSQKGFLDGEKKSGVSEGRW